MDPAEISAPPRWGLADAVAGWLIGMFSAVVIGGLWMAATDQDATDMGTLAVAQMGLWFGLLGAPLYAARTKGSGSLVRDFGLVARARDGVAAIPIGVVCQLVLVPLIYLPLQSIVDVDELDEPARELADNAHGIGVVVLAVVLVVGAPIVEELFFRGLLLRSLARRYGDGWALAGSSFGFALAHVQGLQFPALLAVGVVFGRLAQRAGRLGPSIFAHGAFNLVVVIALALERG